MKLSPDSRFAHPVLSRDTADYRSAVYEMALEYEEDFQSGLLTLTCAPTIQCPAIEDLLRNDLVGQCLAIGCRETYYRELHDLDVARHVVIPLDALFGRVEITPLLVAKTPI